MRNDGPLDPGSLMEELRRSVLSVGAETGRLRQDFWAASGEQVVRAALLAARTFGAGGKLLAFGNGGSAADAQDLVTDLVEAPVAGWFPLPAMALVQDRSVVTGVGAEVGFRHVFARQVSVLGEPGDLAVAFSTAEEDPSVMEGLRAAREGGLGTVAFTGSPTGAPAAASFVDVAVSAPTDRPPRIQEVHATGYHALLRIVQRLMREEAPEEGDEGSSSHDGEDDEGSGGADTGR